MPSRILTLLIILILSHTHYVSAQKVIDQSAPGKPSWLIEPPSGMYYSYYSGVGSSPTTLSGAKEQAIANVISEIIMAGEIVANSDIQTFHQQSNTGIISQVSREIQQTGQATTIQGLQKEEEYWLTLKTDKGLLYQYWILMKIPKPEYVGFDFSVNQGYGLAPVWRSALLPGWGQRYKGEKQKGAKFLISTATMGAATYISFYMSDSYNLKALNEQDIDNRKFYNDWSSRSYTIGIISGLLTGGLYGYNIFDALTDPGAKRYADSQSAKGHELLAYYDGYSTHIGFNLYF